MRVAHPRIVNLTRDVPDSAAAEWLEQGWVEVPADKDAEGPSEADANRDANALAAADAANTDLAGDPATPAITDEQSTSKPRARAQNPKE